MIYAIVIALIYLAKIVYDRIPSLSDVWRKRLFVITAFAVLFVVCAFRDDGLGIDTLNYMRKYTKLSCYSFGDIFSSFYSERVEIGFALLNKVLSLFFASPRTIIVASAFLFCVGAGHFVYRYADDALTMVILIACSGTYLYTFNIIRQMIACAILMNAWGLLTEKRYKASFVLFALSATFHVTSLIFALVYVFYFMRERKKAVTVTLVVGSLLALNYRPILRLLGTFISSFSYLDNSQQRVSAGGIWAVWGIEMTIILLYLFYYYFAEKPLGKRTLGKLRHSPVGVSSVESMCIPVYASLYIVFSFIGTLFNYMDRFGVYFLPFSMLLLLQFGNRIKEQSPHVYRVYYIGLHVCYVIYFLLFATNLEHYRYGLMF